jgi:hypothetical protein
MKYNLHPVPSYKVSNFQIQEPELYFCQPLRKIKKKRHYGVFFFLFFLERVWKSVGI